MCVYTHAFIHGHVPVYTHASVSLKIVRLLSVTFKHLWIQSTMALVRRVQPVNVSSDAIANILLDKIPESIVESMDNPARKGELLKIKFKKGCRPAEVCFRVKIIMK